METALKIGGLLSLFAISYQDFKERKVSLYLFVLALAFVCYMFYTTTSFDTFITTITVNFAVIGAILVVLALYSRFKLKQALFEVFGFGDLLFFLILASAFPTATFVVLFVSSLFFALLLYIILKPRLKHKTVPLAGLQALFLAVVFALNWMFNLVNFYQ